ncbi:precorrin-2 C(20)-methyltransferase [Modestobacter roseus]|uniref:Precorrin-3 methyltransferase /precorrin-2 C20-methyltransferase /cobalt-factor II C20-methyltransferase n=1 Tax=Modestobacter roseus TaxID=1181884 RepID=A0A562IX07_9ACTN|nr:precorrin-2 C(20)-methyltransferase [Modestobacter roseus]MQA34821.1 precorrin-2 C(20)-methyltransferase [Modestobacter roseus]TWH75549.1 precorrin-3 methyltransferase /precorrin-2 C20-methyltransferase /cobalt-factor II C20-methyltransferase [Modestobacter roseus]
MNGRLYGVGLGPGDPELVTVKAARLIGAADVVAFHAAQHGRSVARGLAAPYLRPGQVEELLVYPVTTETTDHPGGYQGAIDEFYEAAAARLAAHLDAGRDVVVLAEGDPFFYGSYMHMHKRLAHRYPTEVVPGVTSVSGAAAVLGRPLVERDEVLTVLPGTLPADELAEWLATTDSAAVLKLGRTFGNVREAFDAAGVLDRAYYVERATTDRQRVAPLADVDPETVPYFSLALLPSLLSPVSAPEPGQVSAPKPGTAGEVAVVGLGPGKRAWTTPEVAEALAEADDLVGYGPYLDRVPANPRQVKHPSDNRVEVERAAAALQLARDGRRVAVVSSGDPGVFAMAAAVLEVAAESFPDVEVRVLPGLTAAQAVASRVGAPLGHDFAVISLSDVLKPWDVVLDRLRAAASADLVLALYNPRSKARPHQLAEAQKALLDVRDPDTVVVVGRDVGGAEESVRVTTLADLDPETVDMRCLLLIGSTQTRVTPSGRVFTSRRYPG